MIRAVILLELLVAAPAEAATVGEWITYRICRVDPHHAKCPPAPPAAPVQAPAVAPAPVASPVAPVTAPKVPTSSIAAPPPRTAKPPKRVKTKAVKPKPAPVKVKARPKSKFKAAPKRARSGGVVRWWCGYAPKWATPGQIVAGAKTRGYTVSHADAQACLASKT